MLPTYAAFLKKRSLPLALLLIILIFSVFVVNRYLLPPTLNPGEYKTSLVSFGPVSVSVPATGIVNPENEVLLLSPAASIVSSVQRTPGSRLSKGDVIMTLDPRPLVQEIENLRDQFEVMENDLQKNRLNAKSIRVDLDYNADVKKLKISSLKAEITDQEQLLKVGGISPAQHEQTKQELLLAEKDFKTTLEKNAIRLKQLEAEEKGLQLHLDIRNKELESKENLLGRLTVRAPSDGIVLNVFANEGEKVEKDKLLAKISDLSTFKIKGSVDNKYMAFVKTGGAVYAYIDNTRMAGSIGNVTPVIKDKKIEFDVFLEFSQFQKLIPNQEVDLMIIKQQKDSVLRIEQGPALNRSKHQDVYVVKNGKATRQVITTGLIGNEYVEIAEGLNPGDRVVVSDISQFRHRKEIDFVDL
jgi:HlyD family secretion protein